jgi:hypothetical protein
MLAPSSEALGCACVPSLMDWKPEKRASPTRQPQKTLVFFLVSQK